MLAKLIDYLILFIFVVVHSWLMQKYECSICGYVYDPEEGDPDQGVPSGTAFEDLPDEWVCPLCGASKEDFYPRD